MNNPLIRMLWSTFKYLLIATFAVVFVAALCASGTMTVAEMWIFGYRLNLNFVIAAMAAVVFVVIRKVIGKQFSLLATLLVFFLSCPFYLGNDIVSMWGGTNQNGSIYSLFSVYQNASDNAYSVVNVGLGQSAGKVAS